MSDDLPHEEEGKWSCGLQLGGSVYGGYYKKVYLDTLKKRHSRVVTVSYVY